MAGESESFTESSETSSGDQSKPTVLKRAFLFLFRNYLAIGLAFLVIFGVFVPAPGVFLSGFPTHYICVVGLFFHSGIKLKTGEVKNALKSYKALILGIVCVLILTPIVGVELTSILPFDEQESVLLEECRNGNNSLNHTTQRPPVSPTEYQGGDSILGVSAFRTGIQMYFIVPCTISAGMVMVGIHGTPIQYLWRWWNSSSVFLKFGSEY